MADAVTFVPEVTRRMPDVTRSTPNVWAFRARVTGSMSDMLERAPHVETSVSRSPLKAPDVELAERDAVRSFHDVDSFGSAAASGKRGTTRLSAVVVRTASRPIPSREKAPRIAAGSVSVLADAIRMIAWIMAVTSDVVTFDRRAAGPTDRGRSVVAQPRDIVARSHEMPSEARESVRSAAEVTQGLVVTTP